mmetsp:Transcript_17614/g.27774  ORF Transcript_17614/g.27774 Transcript_17614/m.27774 type:complete len:82 (-) Transcript_17614:51-296(-)
MALGTRDKHFLKQLPAATALVEEGVRLQCFPEMDKETFPMKRLLCEVEAFNHDSRKRPRKSYDRGALSEDLASIITSQFFG